MNLLVLYSFERKHNINYCGSSGLVLQCISVCKHHLFLPNLEKNNFTTRVLVTMERRMVIMDQKIMVSSIRDFSLAWLWILHYRECCNRTPERCSLLPVT